MTNRQDWHVCELAQKGAGSRGYTAGRYSLEETDTHAFDRDGRRALHGGAAGPRGGLGLNPVAESLGELGLLEPQSVLVLGRRAAA